MFRRKVWTTDENIMTNKLINLIKKSNVIVISGAIGTGKTLLMSKIFRSPNLPGKRLRNSPFSSVTGIKYFLEEFSLLLWEKSEGKTKSFLNDIQIARHYNQRYFLVINKDSELFAGVRAAVDLYIETKGVTEDEKWLHLVVKHNGRTFKKKISFTPHNSLLILETQINGWI